MPSNIGVVDAFKNLIRHGKAHQAPRHDGDPDIPTQTLSQPRNHQRELREPQSIIREPKHNEPTKSPPAPYQREAEMIVQEERQAKTKMPTYKGLERFKLLDKMGDGAFSNVYKAVDLTTGQKVAVKVVRKFELNASQAGDKHLSPQFKKKPRATERANILKEVQIMRGIDHPSVVKLSSFSESPEHYFLVLELLEGGELFHQIVKLTYFSENLSRHVILQVAQGIRYLHEERGVVHRDIKPENLLFEPIPIIPSEEPPPKQFDEEKEDEGEFDPKRGGGGIGRVKIADFGLSKVVWNEETMTPCGTVGYTAPEIVKDERYSKSVDMWALGCVLYTLLCGFPPFYDESINVLTEKVARGHYTFLSPWWDTVSDSAKDLITHLLCVDPAQRYTIDEFLDHPWCKAVPTSTPIPTPRTLASTAPMDSPLLQSYMRGERDGRSPGLSTLKEAFDITYAVHRMEEEGARRRAGHDRADFGQGVGGRWLPGLNEEDEGEDDERVVEEARLRHNEIGILGESLRRKEREREKEVARVSVAQGAVPVPKRKNQGVYDGRAGPRDQSRGERSGFQLDMDNATLIGRRHRRGVGPTTRSPLSQDSTVLGTVNAPQSPMHL